MFVYFFKIFFVVCGLKVWRNGGRGGFEFRGNFGFFGVVEVEGVVRKRIIEWVWVCVLLVVFCIRGYVGVEKVCVVGERIKVMIYW